MRERERERARARTLFLASARARAPLQYLFSGCAYVETCLPYTHMPENTLFCAMVWSWKRVLAETAVSAAASSAAPTSPYTQTHVHTHRPIHAHKRAHTHTHTHTNTCNAHKKQKNNTKCFFCYKVTDTCTHFFVQDLSELICLKKIN